MYRNIKFMGEDTTPIELAIYAIFAVVIVILLVTFIGCVALIARILFG
jgi:hypothetical protein